MISLTSNNTLFIHHKFHHISIFIQTSWLCPLCKKKLDLQLKTGRWFHGKEVKKHNPAREIERTLLTAPVASKPKQLSPKIIKTGFPASSVTKAQLEEQAGEEARRNSSSGSYQSDSTSKKSSLHEQILGSKLSESESDSSGGSKRSSLSTPSKKHVTFHERGEYNQLQNHIGIINKPKEVEEVVPLSMPPPPPETSLQNDEVLKVCVQF